MFPHRLGQDWVPAKPREPGDLPEGLWPDRALLWRGGGGCQHRSAGGSESGPVHFPAVWGTDGRLPALTRIPVLLAKLQALLPPSCLESPLPPSLQRRTSAPGSLQDTEACTRYSQQRWRLRPHFHPAYIPSSIIERENLRDGPRRAKLRVCSLSPVETYKKHLAFIIIVVDVIMIIRHWHWCPVK